MPTKKQTISVRLDDAAKRRVEHAAKLLKQSSGAFLEKAGDEQAREVLLSWAANRYRSGEGSFSELAAETGLEIEAIMRVMGGDGEQEALAMFLTSCQTVAETGGNPEFLRLGEEAVEAIRRGAPFLLSKAGLNEEDATATEPHPPGASAP